MILGIQTKQASSRPGRLSGSLPLLRSPVVCSSCGFSSQHWDQTSCMRRTGQRDISSGLRVNKEIPLALADPEKTIARSTINASLYSFLFLSLKASPDFLRCIFLDVPCQIKRGAAPPKVSPNSPSCELIAMPWLSLPKEDDSAGNPRQALFLGGNASSG